MKGALYAVLCIAVMLALMLLIHWATSAKRPAAGGPNLVPAAPRPLVLLPAASRPTHLPPPLRDLPAWPPAAAVPARHQPTELQAVRQPATQPAQRPALANKPSAAQPAATRPAEIGIVERIEDWLDDWQRQARKAPDSRRDAAAEYLVRGDFERAATAFDRLLVQNPNDPDLLMGEATALTRLGRPEDALPLLLAILERDPRHVAARYHYAVALARLDRREEAIAAFTQLLEMAPGHTGAAFNRAILMESIGRTQDALAAWRTLTDRLTATRPERPASTRPAQSLSPELALAAWFHHGEVALAMYQVKEAESCFLEVTRRMPADARAWCNLGIARATLARWDEAAAALNEALRYEPTLVPAINQLAYVHAVKYRDYGTAADRQKVLDLCARSLAVRSDQPNIRSLRNALLDADREPPPSEEDTPSPDSE